MIMLRHWIILSLPVMNWKESIKYWNKILKVVAGRNPPLLLISFSFYPVLQKLFSTDPLYADSDHFLWLILYWQPYQTIPPMLSLSRIHQDWDLLFLQKGSCCTH